MGFHKGKEIVAKAKKSGIIFLVIGLAIIAGGLGIFAIGGAGEIIGVIIAFVGAIVALVGAVKIWKANDLAKQICPECATRYTYDDIEYHETGYRTDSKGANASTPSRKVTIRFKCHCSNCGYVQEYSKEYTEAKIDKNGDLHEINIEDEIRRFYKG